MENPFQYQPEHKVIICVLCNHCITGSGAKLHLQRIHKEIPLQVRKEWCRHVTQIVEKEELLEPDNVILPQRTSGAVKELKLVDGFECLICGHVCGKLVTAQLHARKHGWAVKKSNTWKSQHVQVCCYILY
jgi:hypothetical protein